MLINTKLRVQDVQQRIGGHQMLQAALAMIQHHDVALPAMINEKLLADSIAKIQKVPTRYNSPRLAARFREYARHIASFAGLTYAQLLLRLQGVADRPHD
jgi:hypothetical protein